MTASASTPGRPGHRWRVVVTRRLPAPTEEALLAAYDAELNESDLPFDAARLTSALREADAVLCTIGDRFPREAFAGGVRARALVNFGVGVDHIPLDAARAAGVAVTNTPGVLTDDTADAAMLLLLAAMRRASEGEALVRAGDWTGWAPTQLLGHRLTRGTLGIVGLGRIGSAVARRAALGFDMRVRYTSRSAREVPGIRVERCGTLEELLRTCDAVSLHVPSTAETRHMIGERELAWMQPHAVLVNTARGDVVDQDALIEALRSRTIAAAGLDVYDGEPSVPEELRRLPNVTLLPHLGSATRETRVKMGERALANLAAIVAGTEPPDRVP